MPRTGKGQLPNRRPEDDETGLIQIDEALADGQGNFPTWVHKGMHLPGDPHVHARQAWRNMYLIAEGKAPPNATQLRACEAILDRTVGKRPFLARPLTGDPKEDSAIADEVQMLDETRASAIIPLLRALRHMNEEQVHELVALANSYADNAG